MLYASNIVYEKIIVLSAVLIFFLAIHAVHSLTPRKPPTSKVRATIKLAVLGFILLLAEKWFEYHPEIATYVGNVQMLIVMLCGANLAAYLLVDVYLHYRMKRNVPTFIREAFLLLVYVTFSMLSLRVVFHIEVSSILTTTTVLTAAVAFAMQTTIANVISGVYIQGDTNLQGGTWVAVKEKDVVGRIVNVGFRYTTLMTLDNQKVMIPNSYLMQNIVHTLGNAEAGERSAVNLRVSLGFDLPPEKAIYLMGKVLLEEGRIARSPAPLVTVHNFLESGIEYNLKYHLEEYSDNLPTRGHVLRRIWYAVHREGHSFPFPQRELIQGVARRPFPGEGEYLRTILKNTELLSFLTDEEIEDLCGRVRIKVFGGGETVFRQGEKGDSLCVVRSGRLNALIDGTAVGVLGQGEIFGEMSLLTGEARKATIVADTETHLVEIAKEDVEPILRNDPELLEKLSAILAGREEKNRELSRSREQARTVDDRKEAFLGKLKAFFNI
jgi:small-conductance mechanosensitive channel/CRP-like cAMP-binding protein